LGGFASLFTMVVPLSLMLLYAEQFIRPGEPVFRIDSDRSLTPSTAGLLTFLSSKAMNSTNQNQTGHRYFGVDISKDTFDLAIATPVTRHYKFPNNAAGFDQLLLLLNRTDEPIPQPGHVVMEASGPYYQQLASYLHANHVAVSVVNPLVIRRFAQMRLIRAKTDKKDALTIARYAEAECPQPWVPQQEADLELRQLYSSLELLESQRTALSNHRHAQQQSGFQNVCAAQVIQATLDMVDQQIKRVQQQMARIAQAAYGGSLAHLESVPGIGRKTAIVLLSVTGCFSRFSSAKQVCSYFGICPRVYESGTSVRGKSRITKMGMGGVRKLLYMCAISAARYNRSCRELYERLRAKGKASRAALMAVANKLIRQAFAVTMTNTTYKP
jgi:transposase